MSSEYLFFEGYAATETLPVAGSRRGPVNPPADAASEETGNFIEHLLRGASLPAKAYRVRALRRRIPACLRFLGVATVEEAARRIESSPASRQMALNAMLLGVTGFFRDAQVFARLRDAVLPALLAKHEKLRVWSAACSSGQELYSVAMLLSELGRLDDCELLGTDCRATAIEEARRGVFEPAVAAPLDPRSRGIFSRRMRIPARAKAGWGCPARWHVADLFSAVEQGPWHLILWRNMAIYLESASAAEIWHRLCEQLAPGGYIVCGKADCPPTGLPLVREAGCIYRHRIGCA